jgi:hypothetical protein
MNDGSSVAGQPTSELESCMRLITCQNHAYQSYEITQTDFLTAHLRFLLSSQSFIKEVMAFLGSSECSAGRMKDLSRYAQKDPGIFRDRLRNVQTRGDADTFRRQSWRGQTVSLDNAVALGRVLSEDAKL